MKRIIRVFPARTHATPDDDLVRINAIPSLFDEADEVHISVAFTWHLKWAEWAAKQWAFCCAGESRRPSPQRAGRGLYTGHVPKERLRYHLARLPKPLLVLRCSQT